MLCSFSYHIHAMLHQVNVHYHETILLVASGGILYCCKMRWPRNVIMYSQFWFLQQRIDYLWLLLQLLVIVSYRFSWHARPSVVLGIGISLVVYLSMLCLVSVDIDSLLLHFTALNVKRSDIDKAAALTTWLFSVWVWMFVPPRIIWTNPVREAGLSS